MTFHFPTPLDRILMVSDDVAVGVCGMFSSGIMGYISPMRGFPLNLYIDQKDTTLQRGGIEKSGKIS
jgi:hypothetical protein